MGSTKQSDQIVNWLNEADGLLITAGAGMGVDSGLPDFRGNEGFWQAYPALGQQKIPFTEIANGQAFLENPEQAWGFYGHRLNLYRKTVPHAGFGILQALAANLPNGAFVFTMIRINPRDAAVRGENQIGIGKSALAGLREIAAILGI